MPRLTSTVPRYRHHKASGQAVVRLNGNEIYLGPHGTRVSKREYDRLIAEWLRGGRRLPVSEPEAGDLLIVEMLAQFFRFAKIHYRKDGEPTGETENMRASAAPLKNLYGHTPVADFGPIKLKAVQQQMILDGLCRSNINGRISRIKRIFRWAVSEQLCAVSVLKSLESVSGLQAGRTAARESEPVEPVSDNIVEATLPHLPEIVADMVRLQRLAGCRPGEVCGLRPCDVDRTGDVWTFKPSSHKTQHRGKGRVIFFGPRAQAILRPYLLRAADDLCFTPAESEKRRKAAAREVRKTKVQPSQVDRSKADAIKKPGSRYTKNSYCRAISRGCEKAFPAPKELKGAELKAWHSEHRWAPNRLRHTAATEIRRQFGLEAAQVVLGHSKADVTQVYAERDMSLASQVMGKIG